MSRRVIQSPGRQRGFSLVELMVAGVLGLILLGGVIQLFLGSNQNYTLQGEISTIQEDGRFAMLFLEDQIQRGSWTEDQIVTPAINLAGTTDGMNDSIQVSYRTLVDGISNVDCNGAVTPGPLVSNRFFVVGTDLMCQGNGGNNAQPILANVERFQVLYGVETDPGCADGVVNSYVNAGSIAASDRILSVRVALLLTSETGVLPEAETQDYQMLDQAYTPVADRLIRRLFQQTIFMPNAVYSTVGSPEAVIECMISKV